jgi:DNA-3-methyladenine glycosylase
MKKLPLRFYRRDTEVVAQELLGKRLVRIFRGKRYSGIIHEAEAYLGENDSACHTWKRRNTKRVQPMYLAGGHTYIYFVYGMHYCFNVVTRGKNEPEAVLIRALVSDEEDSPVWGKKMDGPAKLCKALHIDQKLNGLSLLSDRIFVEETGLVPKIQKGPRIGVDYAKEGGAWKWPLRFWISSI